MGVRADAVKNVIIWGNHSSTQFPDVAHAYVQQNETKAPVYDAVQDDAWIKGDFIKVHWNNLIPKPLSSSHFKARVFEGDCSFVIA